MLLRQLPLQFFLSGWAIIAVAPALGALKQAAPRQLGTAVNRMNVPLTPDPRFSQFEFEVVSIKPLRWDPSQRERWFGVKDTPDGFVGHCPAAFIVNYAFRYERAGIDKFSGWILDQNYDVEAKMGPEVAAALEKLSATDQRLARERMLQVMLRDRFKFAYHTEQREVNGLELVVAKNGPKLKESSTDASTELHASRGMRVLGSKSGTEWDGSGTKIESMLGQIGYELGQTVVDRTGLTGTYDFTLRFISEREDSTANPNAPDPAPPLNTALQEQLGLKLVPGKVTKDFIVIDHMDRPSSN